MCLCTAFGCWCICICTYVCVCVCVRVYVCVCVCDVCGWCVIFRGCLRQPLYCFHFNFRYVTLVQYIDIYIIRVPTRNSNTEFIL